MFTFQKTFLFSVFVLAFGSGLFAETYKGPLELTATADGKNLLVMMYDSPEVAVINTDDNKIVRTIITASQPNGIALSADEKTLFVASGNYRSKVQAFNFADGKLIKEVVGGHSPCGLSVSPDGKKLYVCNRFNSTVSEYELPEFKLARTFKTIREPRKSLVTQDGKSLFVTNFLPNDPNNFPDDEAAVIDVACEVQIYNLADGEVTNIRLTNGSHSLHSLAISPDGKYVYVSQILARFPLPTTQLERGWINTNGLCIIDVEKKKWLNTVLLDDIDRGAANPWGVAVSPDGKQIYVALAGTHELCVIDSEPMLKKLHDLADGKVLADSYSVSKTADLVPDDLAFLVGMKKRIPLVGAGARELCAIGNSVYVGMYYNDTINKVTFTNPATTPKIDVLPVGPAVELDDIRAGDKHWNDAALCFQQWLSCASCHPEGRMDALNWDLLNDEMGTPKNAKSLLYSLQTPPAMWHGVRKTANIAVRTGFQFILFAVPDEPKCMQIEAFLTDMKHLDSPYLVDGKLSEKAERGKVVFAAAKCTECHPENNFFTDQKLHDVGSRVYFDRKSEFDTPSLIETWRTAPYMHDGRFVDMKDVFTKGRHGESRWATEPTEPQIDDLVEYILSL
ncbi:MAG: beta-propeller fold lactonase family protein [Planctomycetaceae bacterium]|jgi:DNA-binding beta-propeller fold protein YncE|nr:beta-propeller fold lactonase family protein [Planctomycetaceae bacterium]